MRNPIEVRSAFASTSAVGPMLSRHARGPTLVSVMLVGLGTSTAPELPLEIPRSLRQVHSTTAGVLVAATARAGAAIAELHRRSGLTWEQLARLFEVSRRSLHFWASGKVMAPANEEHLQRLLVVIRSIDRGAAGANRAALLAAGANGTIPFDLLVARRYEDVVALLGHGRAGAHIVTPRLSERAVAARAPRPPEELVEALQDRVHRETGGTRAARSVRVRIGH